VQSAHTRRSQGSYHHSPRAPVGQPGTLETFLQDTAEGISINCLVCRWPTQIVRVDACPEGMGGYCLQSATTWMFQLPESLLDRATLNALEFLAAFVGVLIEFSCGAEWADADVILSQGDSLRGKRAGILKFQRQLPHAPCNSEFVCGLLFERGNRPLHPMIPGEGEHRDQHYLPGFRAVRQRGHKAYPTPLLTFGSSVFQDHPFAGNDHFSHWRIAAAAAQHEALADSTHAKRDSSLRRYECFLGRIGGRLDPFLRQLGRWERLETFACFAAALREGRLDAQTTSTNCARALAGTFRATLDGVAQAYRLHKFESPIHDRHGRLEPILALQLRGNADEDPGV
jgi:hypothetical protein